MASQARPRVPLARCRPAAWRQTSPPGAERCQAARGCAPACRGRGRRHRAAGHPGPRPRRTEPIPTDGAPAWALQNCPARPGRRRGREQLSPTGPEIANATSPQSLRSLHYPRVGGSGSRPPNPTGSCARPRSLGCGRIMSGLPGGKADPDGPAPGEGSSMGAVRTLDGEVRERIRRRASTRRALEASPSPQRRHSSLGRAGLTSSRP